MTSLFDSPLVSERYFFPRPDYPARITPVEVEGATLACAIHAPHPEEAPWLLHFHGNGETVADYVPDIAELYGRAGFNALFAEFRGYGASTGRPALAGMLSDVPAVLRAVEAPPERIFVYGRSIGSIYAIEAAHREPRLGGLIVESGIADVLERVLLRVSPNELGVSEEEMRAEARAHFDHEAKLGGFPGRTLVLHAARDHLVDRSHAERNASWAQRSELVLYPRGDHNSILGYNLPSIVERVRAFAG